MCREDFGLAAPGESYCPPGSWESPSIFLIVGMLPSTDVETEGHAVLYRHIGDGDYGGKQLPKKILFIVVSIVAAEIFIIQWHAQSGEHLKLGSFVEAVFIGVVGALLAELWEVARNFPYTLVVSDDCITVVYPNREKSFRKDEIKLVTETEGNAFRVAGLEISKYGRFGTRLWGCILIPKALPGYESVRSLALSWRRPTSI
jgi:hypothetical protein